MKWVTLIEIAIPLNHNVQSTFSDNISKYRNLTGEQLWRLEDVRVTPVIISATEIVFLTPSRSLDELELGKELTSS